MSRIQTDILVLGSGIAGLTFAIKSARHWPQRDILVLTKTDKGESNTRYAQGGVASVWDLEKDDFEMGELPKSLDKPLFETGGSDGTVEPTPCTDYQNWSTFDLTGDGTPDLVLTRRCEDTSVGVSKWQVFPGGPNGFATSPVAFSLPSLDKPLFQTGGSDGDVEPTPCTAYQNWSTFDLTGDTAPDLVLTRRCEDTSVGLSNWEVYAGACSP